MSIEWGYVCLPNKRPFVDNYFRNTVIVLLHHKMLIDDSFFVLNHDIH